jgi:hypothetical protein
MDRVVAGYILLIAFVVETFTIYVTNTDDFMVLYWNVNVISQKI